MLVFRITNVYFLRVEDVMEKGTSKRKKSVQNVEAGLVRMDDKAVYAVYYDFDDHVLQVENLAGVTGRMLRLCNDGNACAIPPCKSKQFDDGRSYCICPK